MGWKELVLVTGRSNALPCQVRISCDSTDETIAQGILEDLETYLENHYGNYSGEEYEIILQVAEARRQHRQDEIRAAEAAAMQQSPHLKQKRC